MDLEHTPQRHSAATGEGRNRPISSPRARRPTMRDVAALAGVGHKTVSRVFAGAETVDPDLTIKVRRAAAQLGYRPNRAADLRSGQTQVVGFLVPDLGNPFYAEVQGTVETALRALGKFVLTASTNEDVDRESALIDRLIDRRVDGLIIATAAGDHRPLVEEQNRGLAVVFIDRVPEPLVADAVVSDHRLAAHRAVTHLIRNGRTRVAFLGDDVTIQTARERHQGYIEAMTEAGLPLIPTHSQFGLGETARAERATLELLESDHPPQALFAGQNVVTIGAVRALHRMRRQHDIAIVGFDDIPFADSLEPAVTVVAQNVQRIGSIAAERILARIGGDTAPSRVHTVTGELIPRGSGELP